MGTSGLKDELGHIPKSSARPQHLFKLMYRIQRIHSLPEGTPLNAIRRALRVSCSKIMEESFPGFEPL